MNLPSFNDKGDINMSDVMSAKPADFAYFGVDVVGELKSAYDEMKNLDPQKYDMGEMSDFIHGRLDKHTTEDNRNRKGGYTLPAAFCFWYNIYTLLMNLTRHHMSSEEQYARDLDVMLTEIEIARNPHFLIGRNNDGLEKLKGQTYLIPKGSTIIVRGERQTTKANRKVKVNHVFEGHYDFKVRHPRIVWAGAGGYWHEYEIGQALDVEPSITPVTNNA